MPCVNFGVVAKKTTVFHKEAFFCAVVAAGIIESCFAAGSGIGRKSGPGHFMPVASRINNPLIIEKSHPGKWPGAGVEIL